MGHEENAVPDAQLLPIDDCIRTQLSAYESTGREGHQVDVGCGQHANGVLDHQTADDGIHVLLVGCVGVEHGSGKIGDTDCGAIVTSSKLHKGRVIRTQETEGAEFRTIIEVRVNRKPLVVDLQRRWHVEFSWLSACFILYILFANFFVAIVGPEWSTPHWKRRSF